MTDFIIKYWIQILFGLLISFLSFIFTKIEKYKHKVDDMKIGIQVILKTKIIEMYDKLIKKECINIYEKEIFMDLYNSYKSLEGNSFVKTLVKEINLLPVQSDCNKD
ncbi:MAG: hypothetical protein RR228_04150 [Bacilli bacterium]